MPGRHNPELGGDIDRCKLRLRQTNPVLLRHFACAQHGATFKEILQLQQLLRFVCGCSFLEQRHDTAALPAVLGRRHAGLTKQRLFGIGLCIGVFHRYAERIERVQRIAHALYPVFRAHQAQFVHGKIP